MNVIGGFVIAMAIIFSLVPGCGGDDIDFDEAVKGGQLDVREEVVLQTMLMEDGYTREQVEKLAQQKAEELKEEYPDRAVNVQAVREGKNLANIEIE